MRSSAIAAGIRRVLLRNFSILDTVTGVLICLDGVKNSIDAYQNRNNAVKNSIDAYQNRDNAIKNGIDGVENSIDAVKNSINA